MISPGEPAPDFTLTSDDGAQLWIDGQLVVDNDGLHTSQEKHGVAVLAAGPHPILVCWFNQSGGADLELSWKSVAQPSQPVPDAAFSH